MLLLYFFWNFVNYIVYLNKSLFDLLFYKSNKFNFVFKRSFKKLNIFNKIFFFFLKKENIKLFSFFFINLEKDIDTWKSNMIFSTEFFDLYSNKMKNKFFYLIKLNIIFNKLKKFFNKINYFEWLILQKIFFKSYFNLLNLDIFKKNSINNLIKINFIIFFCNKKFKNIVNLYNLNYYNDWFLYSFNKKVIKSKKKKTKNVLYNELKKNKLKYLNKITNHYNVNYFNIFKFKKNIKNNFFLNKIIFYNNYKLFFKNNFFKNILINENFYTKLKNLLPTRFSDSSLNKYINFYNLKNYSFFYVRKNKIFNKSRYSRNRQLYRTGVYWCLWLNIIIVYGLYFLFYRFSFNFGYIWFGLFILFFSSIFSRICKYNFFNIYYLLKEFINLFVWLGLLLKNIFYILEQYYIDFFNKSSLILMNKSNLYIYNIIYFFNIFLKKINKKEDYGYAFLWENYKYHDDSFLKYKSIIHWFVQVYKVITY